MHNCEVVYTPWSNTGFGPGVWIEMFRQLWLGRGLMWRLFLRDLSARYRQSVFGYFWAVFPAIVMTLVFAYLRRGGTLPIGETTIAYPAFLILGLTVWQLFSMGLTRTAQSLANARAIIVHINFSRETLVIAAFGEAVFNFLIRLFLVVGILVWFKIVPAWTTIFVPFVLMPLCLMTVGLGFLLALANGVFRDIANSLTLILMFAMFAAPVIYPPPTHGLKVLFNYLNPASPFIIATRDLVIEGTLSQPYGLLWMSVASVVVFFGGWRIFNLAMTRVAERV
jgi:lipopolysaccharide transport system permease protein